MKNPEVPLTEAGTSSGPVAFPSWTWMLSAMRGSSLPYVGSIVLTLMLASFVNYLARFPPLDAVEIKGQALSIAVPLVGFPVTFVLWWFYKGRRTQSVWTVAFLLGIITAWLVHIVLTLSHGDLYAHTIWLYVPLVLLLLFKTPTSNECWQALVFLGWLAVCMLVLTRVLEILEIIPMFKIEQWVIEYEKARYFLPFSGHLGIEGRWAGPFGYNSKTGLVSVLLIVLGAARWTKSSWVFVIVGSLGLLLTSARGSYLALLAGLLVLVLFASRGPISRIRMTARVIAGVVAVALAGLFFFEGPLGSSGRVGEGGIWDIFLALWKTSIWTGVGQTGIWASPEAMVWLEAHSIYVQELAKYGLIGFIVQAAALGFGCMVLCLAAIRRWAGPLAMTIVYFVASISEIPNEWENHSLFSFLIILCVVGAGSWIQEKKSESLE